MELKGSFSGLFIFLSLGLFGQTQLISGWIVDEDGSPIPGAEVIQVGGRFIKHSDSFGAFHLVVDTALSDSIEIREYSFIAQTITRLDTIRQPLTIVLEDDHSEELYKPAPYRAPKPEANRQVAVSLGFIGDFTTLDFSEFEPIVRSYNMEPLQNSGGVIGGELDISYRSFLFGVSYALLGNSLTEHDTLQISKRSTQYGVHFGYHLVNSHRFIITPRIALKWNRHRLVNSIKARQVPIELYEEQRDMDIRFNQLNGFVGLSGAYKVHEEGMLFSDYVSFGLYLGYVFSFNEVPWVYSRKNRLVTDSKLKVGSLNWGVTIALHYN